MNSDFRTRRAPATLSGPSDDVPTAKTERRTARIGTSCERSPDYRGTLLRSDQELQEWHAQAHCADAIEPWLPIVDAHHHLFGHPQDRIHYRMDALQRDISGGHKVIGTVYCEAYFSGWRQTGPRILQPVGEVEFIVDATTSPSSTPHGDCQVAAGIVSHADMTLGDAAADVLEAQLDAGRGRLRGVRHRTATVEGTVGSFIEHPPAPRLMCDPKFKQGVAQLQRYGLSFDAWIYHTQLEEFIALADAFPDTTFILNHVGAPIGVAEYRNRRAEVLAYWETQLRVLAARPNVFVKIGGMGMTVFGFGFEHGAAPAQAGDLAHAWKALIDLIIEVFGTQRCMFESNFPVDKQSCSYTELWNAFKLCTRDLSPAERCDLFYRTACRVYRLPDLERLGDSLAAGNSLPENTSPNRICHPSATIHTEETP